MAHNEVGSEVLRPVQRVTKQGSKQGKALRVNAVCSDCGSYLENWTTYYRCPWTTRARRFSSSVDGVQAITCGWVAAAPRTEITAPISGKRA